MVISPGETGILYSQHVRHCQTYPKQDYVAHQENNPAGCSKNLSRKATASEDRRRYPPHFVELFARTMDLGERKNPPEIPISENLFGR